MVARLICRQNKHCSIESFSVALDSRPIVCRRCLRSGLAMLTILAFIFLLLGRSGESSMIIGGNESNSTATLFVNAAREILESFYVNKTTTVFIITGSQTDAVIEVVSEIARTKTFQLCYFIEESEYIVMHRRYFSMFIVDSYESFQ